MNVKDAAPAKADANKTATLSLSSNQQTMMPVRSGTIGPDVIDVARLYRDTGCFTYDPGFTSTANCSSRITYIDGDQGVLLYRGYPIEQLAQKSNFLEVCYLLLYGDLPTKSQYDNFRNIVTRHTMVHEQMTRFFTGFRRDAHPMAVMCGSVGALSAFYHDSTDINDPQQRIIASHRLIAKMPTLAAMAYKYSVGQPFIYPRNDLDFTANFLQMCFAVPCEPYVVNPVVARALDRILILHADHEQNASTSTVRLAGSSGANPFACIAAGIACLWGPAHGGANEAALKMLEEIGTVDRVPEYVKKAKDKNSEFRLMGFGHRVYKNYDPRAKVMAQTCHEVLELARRQGPADPQSGHGARAHRAAGRLFHREEALSQHRLLFGHHAARDGLPALHVHGAVRGSAHGRLGVAVERDDRGPGAEDRPAAPALHRRHRAALRADRPAQLTAAGLAPAAIGRACRGREPSRARPERVRSSGRRRAAPTRSARHHPRARRPASPPPPRRPAPDRCRQCR